MPDSREFDVVVYGASGFTGKLTAEYLLARHGTSSLRWALAGRSADKLARTRDEIAASTGSDASGLEILTADSGDAASIAALAERARVVCTTVGPYALYGSELVEACAKAGTHYCDLTGEVHWMRRMIDAHQDAALASGARIVFTCGFDCIPSDLSVHWLQGEMRSRHDVSSPHVKMRVAGFSGGASGGTAASMVNMMEEAAHDPNVRRVMADPYSLNPKDLQSGPDGRDGFGPAFDDDFGQWTAPFVMAAVDTRVVRRSNALLDFAYGQDFRYDEAMLMGTGPLGLAKATGLAAALGGGMAAAAVGPVRGLLKSRMPAPGEGPSAEQREKGYWDMRLVAKHPTDSSKDVRGRATGDRDPGYGSTSKMLGEAAVCLAQDALPDTAGMLTPAAAMGDTLRARLEAHAGVSFVLEDA